MSSMIELILKFNCGSYQSQSIYQFIIMETYSSDNFSHFSFFYIIGFKSLNRNTKKQERSQWNKYKKVYSSLFLPTFFLYHRIIGYKITLHTSRIILKIIAYRPNEVVSTFSSYDQLLTFVQRSKVTSNKGEANAILRACCFIHLWVGNGVILEF